MSNAPPSAADLRAALPDVRPGAIEGPELETVVSSLARRPELWRSRVAHDPTGRRYEELLHDAGLAVWLICWMDGHDTGFHDHDVSAGAVAVVDGSVREERLTIDGPPRDRRFGAGEVFSFSPADIHRITHAGSRPAVTIHAYSPPLERMGAYVVSTDGVLRRRALPASEELRPLS